MKILSYSLFCFIFCFLGLCGNEDDCAKLEKQIKLTIFSTVVVSNKQDTGIVEACNYSYEIGFYKDHCGGDPGPMITYKYQGCGTKDSEYTRVNQEMTGLWELTFTYEKDLLNVNFVDSRFNGKITRSSISGKEIYKLTNGGSTLFSIYVIIFEKEVEIGFTG
jgi:hypothetical protein